MSEDGVYTDGMDDQPDFDAPELADLIGDTRAAYGAAAPAVSPALASLFEGEAVSPRSPHVRRTLVLIAATMAVLAATGGLAAAGALPGSVQDAVSSAADTVGIDVPDSDDAEGNHGAEVSAVAKDKSLQGCEHGRAVSAIASGKVKDKPCPDTTTTTELGDAGPTTTLPEDGEGDGEGNHGSEVSEVAKDKTLQGCEHGRAVSEVASGTANDKPCPQATTTSTTVEPAEGSEVGEGSESGAPEVDNDDGPGNGNGNGNGRGNGRGQQP